MECSVAKRGVTVEKELRSRKGDYTQKKYRMSSFSKGKKLFSSWLIIPCLSSMFPAAKRLWAQLSILTPDTMKPSFLKWWSRVKICVLHPKNEKEWRIFSVQGSFNLSSSSKHLLQIFRTFGALRCITQDDLVVLFWYKKKITCGDQK